MKIYFELKKEHSKSKSGLIRAIVINAGRKERIPTGILIDTKNWLKGYPKQMAATASIKEELKKYEAAFDEYIRMTVTGFNEIPSLSDAKAFINSKVKGINTERGKKNIRSLMQVFFDEMQNDMKEGTRKEYRTVLKHLYDFNPNVQFADFNYSWGEKWKRWMSAKGTKNKNDKSVKNVQSVTINKHISSLKTFCKWAVKNKHTGATGYDDIKMIKIIEQRIITLTQDEFNLYANYDFSKNIPLQQQRDMFCFVAYTSLRFEDIKQVEDSVKNVGKDYILHINTHKKGKELKMRLIDEAVAILKKYDFKLPIISNQKTNEYIKAGVKAAEINRKEAVVEQYLNEVSYPKKYVYDIISIHDARKTFTSLALESGMSIAEVMSYTTHEDYRSMKPYINLEKKKSDAKLQLVFKKAS